MEPPTKRRRVSENSNSTPRAENDHQASWLNLQLKFKSKLEAIFEKYNKDFTGVGDEVDLRTGHIVVNNGHLSKLRDEGDIDGVVSDPEPSISSDDEDVLGLSNDFERPKRLGTKPNATEVLRSSGSCNSDPQKFVPVAGAGRQASPSSAHGTLEIPRHKIARPKLTASVLNSLSLASSFPIALPSPSHTDLFPEATDPKWQTPQLPQALFAKHGGTRNTKQATSHTHVEPNFPNSSIWSLPTEQMKRRKRRPNWTKEEIEKLRHLRLETNPPEPEFEHLFPGRSITEIRGRWYRMKRMEVLASRVENQSSSGKKNRYKLGAGFLSNQKTKTEPRQAVTVKNNDVQKPLRTPQRKQEKFARQTFAATPCRNLGRVTEAESAQGEDELSGGTQTASRTTIRISKLAKQVHKSLSFSSESRRSPQPSSPGLVSVDAPRLVSSPNVGSNKLKCRSLDREKEEQGMLKEPSAPDHEDLLLPTAPSDHNQTLKKASKDSSLFRRHSLETVPPNAYYLPQEVDSGEKDEQRNHRNDRVVSEPEHATTYFNKTGNQDRLLQSDDSMVFTAATPSKTPAKPTSSIQPLEGIKSDLTAGSVSYHTPAARDSHWKAQELNLLQETSGSLDSLLEQGLSVQEDENPDSPGRTSSGMAQKPDLDQLHDMTASKKSQQQTSEGLQDLQAAPKQLNERTEFDSQGKKVVVIDLEAESCVSEPDLEITEPERKAMRAEPGDEAITQFISAPNYRAVADEPKLPPIETPKAKRSHVFTSEKSRTTTESMHIEETSKCDSTPRSRQKLLLQKKKSRNQFQIPRKEVRSTSQPPSVSLYSLLGEDSADELTLVTPTATAKTSARLVTSVRSASPRCGRNGVTCKRPFCLLCIPSESDVGF